jgi:GntR family transcriptional regulator
LARYQQIERWLRARVLESVPGDPLPSETELAERFNVTRMTARQAMQDLAREGLINRKRGSGTFVAQRPIHRHEGFLMSFSEDMRRRGMVASSQILDASLRPATVADLEALRLPNGARVVSIARLRLADGLPLAIENAVLRPELAGVLAANLEGSLHEALVDLGYLPRIAHSWITARVATKKEAELLSLKPRSPLVVERRIIYDANDVPFEHTETAYVAERYVIDAVFTMSPASSAPRTAAPTAPA